MYSGSTACSVEGVSDELYVLPEAWPPAAAVTQWQQVHVRAADPALTLSARWTAVVDVIMEQSECRLMLS